MASLTPWRWVSFGLLALQAVILLFPTVVAVGFLVSATGMVWKAAAIGNVLDLAAWWLVWLGLISGWWLLLVYLYDGAVGARKAPRAVWMVAVVVALLSLVALVFTRGNSGLQGLAMGSLFVPTFLHLIGEVWVWPPVLRPAAPEPPVSS